MRTTWHHATVLSLVLLAWTVPVSAYTYHQVGVFSNFVIHEGKVYFTQSDGSLTVLNLETGEVIARSKERWYARSLQLTDAGILLSSYRGTTLLSPSNLKVIWQGKKRHVSGTDGDRLILYDGSGLVECRQRGTGKILWTYNLPGALDIVVEKEKVLVFRSAVFDGPDRAPAVVLLDLETGRETFHKTTPPGVHYIDVYFDGDRTYLPAGTYQGEHTPNISRYDKGRPSARFEKLLVWDLNGNEVDSVPVPENLRNDRLGLYDEAFSLGGKYFMGHRAYDSLEVVPPWSSGLGELVPNRLPINPDTAFTRFTVVGGSLTMRPAAPCRNVYVVGGDQPLTINLESEHAKWAGTLPYLPAPGALFAVGSTPDRILLGSNLGHVECVEAKSGKSLWMYIFPTIRHTTSTSSWEGPPYMATAAAIYKCENRNPIPESGMVLEGSSEPSHPKIILDPAPANPFKRLPQYLAIAWSGAIAPPILVAILAFARRRRHWDSRIIVGLSLLLILPAAAGFWFYGRVSLGSSVGLRVGMFLPLLASFVYSLVSVWERRRITGALLLLVTAAVSIYLLPVFLHL